MNMVLRVARENVPASARATARFVTVRRHRGKMLESQSNGNEVILRCQREVLALAQLRQLAASQSIFGAAAFSQHCVAPSPHVRGFLPGGKFHIFPAL